MASTFPSAIGTLATPQATDRLNNPSHSALHQNENSEILQVERFIGTLPASAVGTILYDVRSPASNGGGHVQTANKGGTGQTSYAKGDLLVGQSSSVIAKLAVSSTLGDVLVADPTQAVGMKWSSTGANKVVIVSSVGGVQNSNAETILFSTSILGGTLGTNNAIRFTAVCPNFGIENAETFTLRVKYGLNTVLTIAPGTNAAAVTGMSAVVEGMIIANNSTSSQKAFGQINAVLSDTELAGEANVGISKTLAVQYGTSSIASASDQNFIVTAQFTGTSAKSSILSQFMVVEKIT